MRIIEEGWIPCKEREWEGGELTPTSSVLDTIEEKAEDTPAIPENNN